MDGLWQTTQKSTPAPATAPGASAPSPKTPNLTPIGKILAKLDEDIVAAKEEVGTGSAEKADVQQAISFTRSKNMGEDAALAIVQQIVPEDESEESTVKRGRPKGSKNKGNAHKGGRGVTISESKQAKIKELAKQKDMTAYAISKKVKVSPKTVAKYM
jgi:hypothetical protein